MSLSSSPAGPGSPPAPAQASMAALDCAAGLDRMMGDEAMYLRVLTRFHSDYADTALRLRAALAGGDAMLAHRIAHTLKGAAAMVEARGLRALALEVEQVLRAGAPADALLLDRLDAELARVIAEVALLLAPAAGIPASGEAALAEADLANLRGLLDLGDSGAQDLMAEKRAGLRARLGAARMAQLESAVAAFDYERALSVLDAR
ncbi:Hpt domain-containing protein [Massilia varians]